MAVQNTTRSEARIEPKSSHVEDAALQPFLQAKFDPVDYLNTTLPALTFGNTARDGQSTRVSLAELTSRTQSLMSQLNAQTSRLTSTLNQLTDEILRSGSRLAYEVEILRGETAGLTDAMNESLREDVSRFVLDDSVASPTPPAAPSDTQTTRDIQTLPTTNKAVPEPDYINNLRTLTQVRARLESVIQTFGAAMQWPIAPSEVFTTSSFISVSAPTSSNPAETRDLEEKSREHAQKLRTEIADLLENADTAEAGINAAVARIEELKGLAEVWKGTAEEKARARLLESLMKPVEDDQKALLKKMESKRRTASPSAQVDYRYGDGGGGQARQGGYGLFKGLAKFKDDMYLE